MANTVAQMTQEEFSNMIETLLEPLIERKLLEILGDPDEGLEIRDAVRQRLLCQKRVVAAGERGKPFEGVVQQLGLG